MEDATPVLELRGITKQFPGVLANDAIDLDLARGEIHALLGENGAGKSTLMNILFGLYKPDEGEILLEGRRVSFSSAKEAIAAGIGMVHQHFMLIPVMTVAENIVLGHEPVRAGVVLDERAARRRVEDVARTFKFAVDPAARVDEITVGQQQRVEIMKALYRNANILILDEPTAVLTPQEAFDLFEILRTLRREGISIIFISHKLNEVLEIADRITVLRRGKVIETVPGKGATEEGLARAMVGRDVLLRVEKAPSTPGGPLLDVDELHVSDDRDLETVHGLSFEVHAGEIVGLAGIDGNGQAELVEAIVGLRQPTAGRVVVAGENVTRGGPRHLIDVGVGHIPGDRQGAGSCWTSASRRICRCTRTGSRLSLVWVGSRHAGSSRGRAYSSGSTTFAEAEPRRSPVRCREETSRRSSSRARSRPSRECWSPLSRHAASTSERSSTSTAGLSRSGTSKRPFSSCLSSSRRSGLSPTESSSSTRASSSASSAPRRVRRSSASP